MLSALAKLFLIMSSLSPIVLTWAFADWRSGGIDQRQAIALGMVLVLMGGTWGILQYAEKRAPEITFNVATVKTADQELIGFILAYLLPLLSSPANHLDGATLAFIAVLIALVVGSSHAFSVNPLLAVLRYHFYEITNDDGVTFLMLSRREVIRSNEIDRVVQLARYLVFDPRKRQ